MPKLLQCRILKASKIDANGQVAKAKVQTTAKYIKFDAWARTRTNKCYPKTGKFVYVWYNFIFIKTEYLWLFMGFKNKNKNLFFPKL